jgi:glycosidase
MKRLSLIFSFVFLSPLSSLVAEETVLQYFNTSWKEIEYRLPEIAEAGYSSLWLPPPTKGGSGTYSVGYDVFDRFDLGDKDQMGTVRTRYGTKEELLSLVEKAHRFGVKIYFDNVMAHNAGPLDNVPAGTLFPGIPGFVPEDFHLVRKAGGGWRKASDSVNYNDEWQVLNRNPFAWDIAYEDWNTSFDPVGQTENLDYPKWIGIRHAGKHWLYLDTDLTVATNADGQPVHPFSNKEPYVDSGYGAGNTGAGNGKFDWQDTNTNGQHDVGEVSEPFTDTGVDPTNPSRQTATWGFGNNRYDMGNIVAEDVNTMVIRSIRWQVDQTNCDGFRLDAVKHVPNYFFGQMSGGTKDRSNAGFLGQAQEQFNVTRGFTDWDNHRDTSFDQTLARNDLVMFGEHLGAPPNPDDYINAGMRIANDDFANGVGNGIGGSLSGYDNPGSFTKGVNAGMMYTLSHDNNYMAGSERPAAHQYMLMRAGLPIIYTDGYNISGGPDYFPKPSYVPFLGQYGQTYITGALRVRRDFVRGGQFGRWSSQNFAAWEFRDKSENTSMNDADGTTLVVLMARNYTSGQGQPGGFTTSLPTNTILRNYSTHGGNFYAYVGNDGKIKELDGSGNFTANQVITPSNGYFAFAPPVPEATLAFEGSTTVRPITIQQNGVDCEMMTQRRVDGKNGDPAYAYNAQIPRVTSATNLSIFARGDGSVANMLVKLDGGMDVNSQLSIGPLTGTKRDNPPDTAPADAKGMETFVGYEQMEFERRMTQKFAAQDITRVIIGSPGAETWETTIGTSGVTLNQADVNGVDTNTDTAQWLLHNPANGHGIDSTLQMQPQPASAAGQPITFVVKVGYTADALGSVKIYYTTDGTSYPEGSGNKGRGSTQIVDFTKVLVGTAEAGGTPEWWRGTIPALPAGTKLRYKIGGYKNTAAPRYPSAMDDVRKKERMETIYKITGFNANTVTYYPHSDKGTQATGLKDGMHVVRTRSFLSRSGKASLYKTNTQTFYLDQQAPGGLIKFPANNGDTLGGSSYGFVVLSDEQTNEVWYQILDTNGTTTWAKATEVNPPQQIGGTNYTKEWRFTYTNIPASGTADVKVRFKELSSSADNNLTDAAGWFTTLTRTVTTGSPANFRIQFPTNDGDTVSSTYQMKVYFNKVLGQSAPGVDIPEAQLIPEFSIYLASQITGDPEGEVFQPRATYGFIRNETGTESALTFTFPNLYNGDPNFLHHVRVEHQRGSVTLNDTRLVKAAIAAVTDSDNDGLPDYWESAHGLDRNNPDGDQGSAGDPDFDGVTNVQEFLFGLSPIASDSIPSLTIAPANPGLNVTFPLIANRRYRLMTSTALSDWQPVGTYTSVTTAQNFIWNVTPADTRRFYRVEVSLP